MKQSELTLQPDCELLIRASNGKLRTQQAADGSVSVACVAAPAPVPTPAPQPQPAPTTGITATPANFAALLTGQGVKAGETIWLRAGTYSLSGAQLIGTENSPWVSKIAGTEAAPVTIRAYPAERAIIEGGIQIDGPFTIWRDLEITNTNPDRTKARPPGFNVVARGTKLINNVIHSCGNGIGLWSAAPDSEIYGNLVYDCGWEAVDDYRAHGHAGYLQSDKGTKLIQDNILFDNYAMGLKSYGEGGMVKGITYDGNISFDNGSPSRPRLNYNRMENLFFGTITNPMERITATNNCTYHPLNALGNNARFAYSVKNSTDVTVLNNYIVGGNQPFILYEWQKALVEGNTIIGAGRLISVQKPLSALYSFNRNTYLTIGAAAESNTAFVYAAPGKALNPFSWDAYKAASLMDANSTYQRITDTASLTPKVFLRPNRYEPNRAHVAVYWANGRNVSLDLSKALQSGRAFEIFNVRDLSKPLLSGIYDGKPVNLSIAGEFAALLVKGKA